LSLSVLKDLFYSPVQDLKAVLASLHYYPYDTLKGDFLPSLSSKYPNLRAATPFPEEVQTLLEHLRFCRHYPQAFEAPFRYGACMLLIQDMREPRFPLIPRVALEMETLPFPRLLPLQEYQEKVGAIQTLFRAEDHKEYLQLVSTALYHIFSK